MIDEESRVWLSHLEMDTLDDRFIQSLFDDSSAPASSRRMTNNPCTVLIPGGGCSRTRQVLRDDFTENCKQLSDISI